MKILFLAAVLATVVLLPSDYLHISDQVLEDYRLEMLLEHGLVLSGSGGRYMNNLNQITQEFSSQGQFSIEEARRLFIQANLKLIKRINQDHNLRPFLFHYPFTFEDIQIKISFYDSEEKAAYPYVTYISAINGKVFYNTINLESDTPKYQLLHSETFEDACALVGQDNADEE